MSVERDKLERFSKAVYNEVNEKIEKILAEAEASRQEILKKVSDESLNIAYEIIQDDIKKIKSKYVKINSKAELDSKRDVLVHREELTKLVFSGVKAEINQFTQTPEYEKYLENTLKEALCDTSADEEIEIHLSPKDMIHAGKLKKATSLENVTVIEDSSIKMGGISILYVKENMVNDKTLDSAIEVQKEEFNHSAKLRID